MKLATQTVLNAVGTRDIHKLLLKGHSPNEVLSNGHTMMEILICLNNLEAAKLCIRYGANVENLPKDLRHLMNNYLERYPSKT